MGSGSASAMECPGSDTLRRLEWHWLFRACCARQPKLALEGGVVAGAVPEMKDLDEVGGFIDPIVDQDGGMHELPDARPSVHRTADVRETS